MINNCTSYHRKEKPIRPISFGSNSVKKKNNSRTNNILETLLYCFKNFTLFFTLNNKYSFTPITFQLHDELLQCYIPTLKKTDLSFSLKYYCFSITPSNCFLFKIIF